MSSFNEQNYSSAGYIEAYELDDINFSVPLMVEQHHITDSQYSISEDAEPLVVPLRKSDGAEVKESPDQGSEGTTNKVTISFNVSHPTEADYEALQQLHHAHHFLLTHLGGEQSLVRATDEGYQMQETGEDCIAVEITVQNVSGVQRVQS